LANQNPIVVQMFGIGQSESDKVIQRSFHWVKRIAMIRENAEFHQAMELLWR
jgi:hypothetical protein